MEIDESLYSCALNFTHAKSYCYVSDTGSKPSVIHLSVRLYHLAVENLGMTQSHTELHLCPCIRTSFYTQGEDNRRNEEYDI